MRRAALGALLVLALLPLAAPAHGAAGDCEGLLPGLGARLLDVPTHLADDERARSAITDALRPGATIERRVRFSNGEDDQRLRLRVEALPAAIRDGSFLIGAQGADRQLADWVELDRGEVVLGPCEHVDVRATVAVPGDAEAGERYAAVTAEHVPSADEAGVSVASRIGIRVYLQVAGPEPATSDFEIEALIPRRAEGGRPTVDVLVVNTGERAVDVSGELALADGPGGLRTDPVSTGVGATLAPGDEGVATVALDPALPAGPWRAVATMRSGRLERRAEAEITFPEEGAGAAVEAHPLQDRGVLVPVAVVLLVVALLGLLVAWRRRRSRDDEEEHGTGSRAAGAAPASLTR